MSSKNKNNIRTEEDGKWAQFWMTKREFILITGVIIEAANQGLRLSQSAIIRKIMEIGWDNIDETNILLNPMSLFSSGGSAK
jgi:hypothetical protein|tara:strand:- start:219 stop:464 length:246 start_codon:yes stop_codon:yes gene_type:complete